MIDYRIGLGHDIHALVENREFWLGGVKIDYHLGLKGHSDADALIHAIMDAMLGALALGDIGQHFPDTDPAYEGASSFDLLEKVCQLVRSRGFRVHNLDCMIHCERPRLSNYKPLMQKRISGILEVEPGRVSIKAGTNEGFGAVGEGRAVECQAIVLLLREQN